ncbi:MAG: TonB-dependent receptor [Alphaproteobacteria bacterium]|nr:TonB-dependent receptor [Alphaproteobacteria bacterium]MBU0792578.1 TonB-dependent receptor [Alphaproteobacteria bacterium]MBU0874788.1 TonB-dependent receptor [Alphaproteobacteria bacterium]MBU1768646.1 TonB-dependent receptor [Alphaproteobacteria bacterium]
MLGMTANARCLLGAASLGTIAILELIAPSPVFAQAERTVEINVPAMPMATALQEISAQSGAAVSSDPDAIKQLTSRPVRGATSAREALEEAIAGTNLAIIQSPNGAFDIVGDIVVTARRDEAETSVLVRQASTSDRSGLGLRDQPRNTQVISAKMIEDQQALDITDVLRNAGGVSVQANNPNSGASYTVRGFSAAGLVNGLAGGSQYGVQSGANQPIANIERVEVLKGPDALLSGFGNLGGNVNVVTKKPSAEQRLAVSFDTGSFGLVRGVIDANNAITADKKLSGRVIASAQTMDHNYGGYQGSEDYLFAPSLRFKDELTDIVIGASLSKANAGIGAYTLFDNRTFELIERDPSVPIYSPDQGIGVKTDRFYFDATRTLTPGIELVVRGMHDETELTLQVYQLGYNPAGILRLGVGGSQQKGKSDALDSFVRVKTGLGDAVKATFNVGYNYSSGYTNQRSETLYTVINNPPLGANTSLPVIPFSPLGNVQIRTEGKQQGVYGQALIEFWKIKLLGGVRKNWFETSTQFFFPGAPVQPVQKKDGVSPSGGIIVDVTGDLSVFVNYVRGEQAIFTLDRDGNFLPNIITTNKEAGVKLDLFGKRATINASYFDIQQDNTVVFNPTLGGFESGPGQRGRGIDLNIVGQLLPGWTVTGSYTRTKYALLTTTPTQTTVARQPRDTYSLYSSYRTRIADGVTGGMSVGFYGRSSSYADLLGRYVVPGARQIDVNGFLSIAGFDVNLGIRNIFDRRNYNTTSTFSYVPVDEPRNVRLSITKRIF